MLIYYDFGSEKSKEARSGNHTRDKLDNPHCGLFQRVLFIYSLVFP